MTQIDTTPLGIDSGHAKANGISLAYERWGQPDDPAVLLIMGLGGQLVMWPDSLCSQLVEAGYQVIRFDNRDVGLSTHFDHCGKPNLARVALAAGLGRRARVPYTLTDMASDSVGLLDALDIPKAHVAGVSMGGMIAQVLSAQHPQRVASLTAMMTSSGHRRLPGPSLRLRMHMLRKRSPELDQAIADSINTFRMIGSPGFPQAEPELRAKVERQMYRNTNPQGTMRQLAAILASGSRAPMLSRISAPTLVLHGSHDPLIPVAAAHDLGRRIGHARKLIIEGWGHDLPEALMPRIGQELIRHFQSV